MESGESGMWAIAEAGLGRATRLKGGWVEAETKSSYVVISYLSFSHLDQRLQQDLRAAD
jgi:hypothetical protein